MLPINSKLIKGEATVEHVPTNWQNEDQTLAIALEQQLFEEESVIKTRDGPPPWLWCAVP